MFCRAKWFIEGCINKVRQAFCQHELEPPSNGIIACLGGVSHGMYCRKCGKAFMTSQESAEPDDAWTIEAGAKALGLGLGTLVVALLLLFFLSGTELAPTCTTPLTLAALAGLISMIVGLARRKRRARKQN